MDKLFAEKEVESKVETRIQNSETYVPRVSIKLKEKEVEAKPEIKTEYLNSLENLTIADIKKKEEEKKSADFKIEKNILIQNQYDNNVKTENRQEVSQKIIEKPNYDFIEENKKVVKLKKVEKSKPKNKKKIAGIALACVLGASALICVTNTVLIDNLNTEFVQIDDIYKFNLAKYLKNINKLDATQSSMEIIETYPDELLDAGDYKKDSNWFDKICSFFGGLFGG